MYYAGKQKLVHNLMIWLVPFLWILLLKTIDRPIGRKSFFQGAGSGFDGGFSDTGGYDSHGYDSGGGSDSGGGDGGD